MDNNYAHERIVGIALLTQRDLERVGTVLHVIPVPEDDLFDGLLSKLDLLEIEPLYQGIVLRAYPKM